MVNDIPVSVTTEDVQAVMQSNPMMALQVQNQALMRRIQELTIELEQAQNGKVKTKEK
tara:strand:- start:222 stop:395 length:174 start_codon:yes stop_codon:yes gene_type:complete